MKGVAKPYWIDVDGLMPNAKGIIKKVSERTP